jgi:Family of unknown function (DUF6327)
MESKQYTTFEQIERDLQILKLEREIHHKKIILHVEQTKESLKPRNLLSGLLHFSIPKNLGSIIKLFAPLLIQWFFNKKRGS